MSSGGSLFYLEPGDGRTNCNSRWPILTSRGPVPALTFEKSTWADAFPVGEVKELPAGERKAGTLVIEAHGKPDAWVVYRPAAGQSVTIDGGAEATDAVLIRDSSYVVLEGVNVIGGEENAVRVLRSRHVCIRHCEMSGWGTLGDARYRNRQARRGCQKPAHQLPCGHQDRSGQRGCRGRAQLHP